MDRLGCFLYSEGIRCCFDDGAWSVSLILVGSHAVLTCYAETPALEDSSPVIEQPLDPRMTPEVLAAFEKGSFQAGEMALPYRLLRPLTVEEDKTYPLVLFLHGMGERGDDNQQQLIHGGRMFASDDFRQRHPAFVLAPQCPAGTEPGTLSRDKSVAPGTEGARVWTWPLEGPQGLENLPAPSINLAKNPTQQLIAVRLLVDKLREELPIDATRIYVVGLSMGGYATWELAAREPDFWAAAVPMCGAGDSSHADRLVDLAIWAFHGEVDPAVPVERSREMVRAIEAVGGRAIYTEYPGVGHDCWSATFDDRHVWDWMFAQRR